MKSITNTINVNLLTKINILQKIMQILESNLPSECIASVKDKFFITPIKDDCLTIIADNENVAFNLRHYDKEFKRIIMKYHNIKIKKISIKVKK
ncbi:MAG: hypothetical protein DRQ51_08465 [Gammaproteobacteria bacterium]|nr:MAG: hypothetical protein DRQ51_08465 [Gammaproteobacteria bacterium]